MYQKTTLGYGSPAPKEQDLTEDMKKKAIEYKTQGMSKKDAEILLQGQYGNKMARQKTGSPTIPSVSKLGVSYGTGEIKPVKSEPIPSPVYQQKAKQTQGIQPTNQGFIAGQQAIDETMRMGVEKQNQILQDYNDDIATIRLEEDQEKAKYKNADQVLQGIRAVEGAYRQGITDPAMIAQQTGMKQDQVNSILRGEGFKDLEMQDRATEEQRTAFQNQIKDLRTQKNRQENKIKLRAEQVEFEYNNTVDDIMRQAGMQQAQMKKAGALTGAISSSGYMTALENVRKDANRSLARLKTITGRDKSEIATASQNLLEDFETNTTRIKEYFDRNIDQLRGVGLTNMMNIQSKYGTKTYEATKALRELHNDIETQKASILRETMSLQTSFNERRMQEIDMLEKYSQAEDRRKAYLDAYQQSPELANALYPEVMEKIRSQQPISGGDVSNMILSGNITTLASQIQEGQRYNAGERGECGERYNDAIGGKQNTWVGDTYESKTQYVDQSITQGEAGMGVVFNPGGDVEPYGHVGVLASGPYVRNGVAGYDVISANYHGDKKVSKDFVQESLIASSGGGFIPTTAKEDAATSPTFGGTSSVDDEVKAYAEAIMNPYSTLTIDKLPSDVRGKIAPYLAQLQSEAYARGDMVGVMLASAGGAKIENTAVQSLTKGFTVINQLDTLKTTLSQKKPLYVDATTGENIDLSPLTGWLRKKNPWDTNAQEIQAILTSMTPMLARGIYGEVGVLTDNDIRLYQQTIPNLRQTEKVKEADLALTLRTVRNGIKDQLEIYAGSGRDVSGLAVKYKALEDKIAEIESGLGISQQPTQQAGTPTYSTIDELPGLDGSYVPFS